MLIYYHHVHAAPTLPLILGSLVGGYLMALLAQYCLPLVLKHNIETLQEWNVSPDIKIANTWIFALGNAFLIMASFCHSRLFTLQLLSSAMLCLLWTLFLVDWYTQFIFDDTLYPLVALGLVMIYYQPWPWYYSVGAALGAFLVMLLLAFLGRGAMGGGDIKLMAAMGLWLGPYGIIHSMMLGFILGGIAAVCFLILTKKTVKDYFAFGPYLITGCIFTWIQILTIL